MCDNVFQRTTLDVKVYNSQYLSQDNNKAAGDDDDARSGYTALARNRKKDRRSALSLYFSARFFLQPYEVFCDARRTTLTHRAGRHASACTTYMK